MIESFGVSDPGCVRTNNEDCFLLLPSAGLYVVADGMGGAQAGEHASRLAVETVRDTLEAAAPPATPARLTARALIIGDSIYDVSCAHDHGIPVLAVATGRTSAAELAAAGADRVVPDLNTAFELILG